MRELRPLSRAMKLLLLDRAILAIHEKYGLPETSEQEDWWQSEVSILYRCCLIARRSAPARTFESASRAQILVQVAAKHGAKEAERQLNQSGYVRSLKILAGEQ